MESQAEIEAFNRRELWKDAANHLRVACESIDTALMALDDLKVPHIAENLQPVLESVARFRDLADVDAAQVLLGHSSVTTTEIYAQPTVRKAIDAAARFG